MTGHLRPLNNTQRVQLSLITFGVALALSWMFMMRPLIASREGLRRSLGENIARVDSLIGTNSWTMNHISADVTRATLEKDHFENIVQFLEGRTRLSSTVTKRLVEPFQLIDFEITRHYQVEELYELARKGQTKINPELLLVFPDYELRPEIPSLLWAHLEASRHAVGTALAAKVSSIESFECTQGEILKRSDERVLLRFPIRLTLKGGMTQVRGFLASLPLRSKEMKAIEIAPMNDDKPALHLRGFDLLKSSPIDPTEVELLVDIDYYLIQSPVPQPVGQAPESITLE